MEIVRAKDTGTLQYEIYFSEDQSECIVLERYRDSEALLEHAANLGELGAAILAMGLVSSELLGEPSAELRASWLTARSVCLRPSCRCRHRPRHLVRRPLCRVVPAQLRLRRPASGPRWSAGGAAAAGASAGRMYSHGGHLIPVMRVHLPALDHGVIDPASARAVWLARSSARRMVVSPWLRGSR